MNTYGLILVIGMWVSVAVTALLEYLDGTPSWSHKKQYTRTANVFVFTVIINLIVFTITSMPPHHQ